MADALRRSWFPYFDLACAILAAALWYLSETIGPWPLLIALLPWGIRLVSQGRPSIATPYALFLLLFVVTAGLSVWAAFDQTAAWAKFWRIVGGILLFYAAANSLHAGMPPRVYGWLFCGFATAVALYFALTHRWETLPSHLPLVTAVGQALQALLPPLPGHRLNPNVVGGMLAFAAPFVLMMGITAVQSRRWLSLLVSILALLALAGGLLLSSSRGAWFALFAALSLGALWELLRFLIPKPTSRRWLFLAILLLGGCALLLYLYLTQSADLLLRTVVTDPTRIDVLYHSLVLAQDYPFLGAGLGSFMMLHVTYAMLVHVGYIIHSHNLFLDVAIEQGAIALLLIGGLWLIFAIQLWRRAGRRDAGMPWLAAAALALFTILVHSLVDDVFYGSRALLLLFLPLAFTVSPPRPADTPLSRRRLLPVFGGGLLLLLLLAGWQQQSLRARWLANLAAVQQSRAELAVYSWPEWPLQDALRRELDMTQPIENFQRALALKPDLAPANRRLGQIFLSLGEYELALTHLAAAYAAQPWDNATRQMYGEALIANGQVEEGRALWETVSQGQGQLLARTFWYQHIGDAQRLEWLRQALP